MSDPVKDVLFSMGFLGFSLIPFSIAIYAWFSGRVLSKAGRWVYKSETPGDYYFWTIFLTVLGTFFTLLALLGVFTTVSRALGI